MTKVESDANVGERVTPIRELFHFTHFKSFYTLYVPIAIVIGSIAGLAMVVFQWLIVGFTAAFSVLPVYVAPIIGGAFSGLLIYLGRNEVQGSGISTAIEMTHEPCGLRHGTALTKMAATSISIGSGNPVGREGPAVLIGAAIGNSVGRRLGFHEASHLRVFLMMGSAAATAGIYKAPLGGALFATEAPYRRDARLGYFVPTVIAAMTSYIVYVLVWGIDHWCPMEAHEALANDYYMHRIQQRLWSLEDRYQCWGVGDCRGKMPPAVFEEYRRLEGELRKYLRKLGR